ncbi:MAG: hypothetical protein WAO23_07210 [Dethiobacteria bacterium]
MVKILRSRPLARPLPLDDSKKGCPLPLDDRGVSLPQDDKKGCHYERPTLSFRAPPPYHSFFYPVIQSEAKDLERSE